jgi:hypothetical protein
MAKKTPEVSTPRAEILDFLKKREEGRTAQDAPALRHFAQSVWKRGTFSGLSAKRPRQHPPVYPQHKRGIAVFCRDDMDQARFV